MNNIKPQACLLILSYDDQDTLSNYIQDAQKVCQSIFVLGSSHMQLPKDIEVIAVDNKAQAILQSMSKAKQCTHIITVDIDQHSRIDDVISIQNLIKAHERAIIVGVRDFSNNPPILSRLERVISSFWLRVQTSVKLQDIHHNTKAYPFAFFDFLKFQHKKYASDYALDVELLVRGAWAGFKIIELPISVHAKASKTRFNDHLRMIYMNFQFIMRALVPLPYGRYDNLKQEKISLRHPIEALHKLMDDPYNRATPWQLARTAAISMSILTVPAPIIQSIFLLFSIGWLKLNRLCAIAMIPLTWPPFLPAFAILVGYRVRHGQWLTEFSVQTLGYEVGQRLWEWVIGSLVLTPILGASLGIIVGLAAFTVSKKR